MALLKPSIPSELNQKFVETVKEVIETITGRRPGVKKIAQLPTTATLADVISKLNEILDRLQ